MKKTPLGHRRTVIGEIKVYAREVPERENGPEKLLGRKSCKLSEFGKRHKHAISRGKQPEIG